MDPETVILTIKYEPTLVTSEFMAEQIMELEGVESVHVEEV